MKFQLSEKNRKLKWLLERYKWDQLLDDEIYRQLLKE